MKLLPCFLLTRHVLLLQQHACVTVSPAVGGRGPCCGPRAISHAPLRAPPSRAWAAARGLGSVTTMDIVLLSATERWTPPALGARGGEWSSRDTG